MINPSAKKFNSIPLSILDLALINEGSTVGQSFKNSVDLAQHAEKWGYNRFWLAEHHNMPGVASSATSVIIGHVAGATETIRVGSGGVMLPNHAPLVIAEQFGTLEAMYPNRIDLGLGRAPGSDQATAYALRRTLNSSGNEFPQQLAELRQFFEYDPSARVRAIPGEGQDIPIWLLGSSDFSARLAADLGLPFSFASHFAPQYLMHALQLYHQLFRPSKALQEPYVMLGVNIIAAETDDEAQHLATSYQQQFLNIRKGVSSKLMPPVDDIDTFFSDVERAAIGELLEWPSTIVGSPETVKRKLAAFIEATKANELIISSGIYNHEKRLRSYELVADMMG
ncbi:LLM class flavin-dependent oxidoreductase [Sporosarcina thermotolerans]|uniref:LLM class flavin-dependent oxidoreductase n=1 Tax=Sporosarcina thermotolerans TaxID=633404 RepID=A0AAW9AER6_9BACL|nr:LLM class flavin-dependent oxidoreductase [Sporosarcina thermotolerans]MDW0117648.1 LLM class flavin-dependent oxidoreductase [Sporosarcina thermotolerans]WHT49256.1 LLM class flavin-dependent oxidoreductase [Sporosarcina thermotolerans]